METKIKNFIEDKEWVNSWLHNIYGLTDDNLSNAGECEEMCEMICRDVKISLIKMIVEMVESEKKVVPKDPLDITPREQMVQLVQPVYRPYVSNEESVNQALDTISSKLNDLIN